MAQNRPVEPLNPSMKGKRPFKLQVADLDRRVRFLRSVVITLSILVFIGLFFILLLIMAEGREHPHNHWHLLLGLLAYI